MKVDFLDLKAAYGALQDEIETAVLATMRSGYYIGGPAVESFEAEFARFCEAEHCVGVGNGLDALQLSLMALGIGPGDEVIVPANTFIATWLAVSHRGGRCVAVEPDSGTCNIDPDRVAAAITSRTKAIIPVHLYGQPADLAPLSMIADNYGLPLIEDAAQAQGARYRGRRIGGHSPLVTWSFYPGKNLGALGDAGAITTDDPELADRLRRLRNYGSPVRYQHDEIGLNSRLDPVQAAVLSVKLRHLDAWNERRCTIAAAYQRAFRHTSLHLPLVLDQAEPVWHLYCVRHHRRDAVREELAKRGIATLIHYPTPPHLQAAYRDLDIREGAFPITEEMARSVFSLPIDPMMTDVQVDHVIAAVIASVRNTDRG